jgi:hypothetical protein
MAQTGEDELIRLLRGQDALVQEVYSILEEEEKKDEVLRAVVLSSMKPCANPLAQVDPVRVFTLDAIRNVCIKYRLRFLPAGRFKGHLPAEALQAIRRIEAGSGAPLGGFMMMAVTAHFKLCDCEADPMLFVPLGGDKFYMVHRWGHDLRTMRAVLGWPVRSVVHLATLLVMVAAFLAALVPSAWLSAEPQTAWLSLNRFALFTCAMLFLGAATSYAWLAFFGQFSKEAWNSSTFN